MKLVVMEELYYGHMDDPNWERKPMGRVVYDIRYPPWRRLVGIPNGPVKPPPSLLGYFADNPPLINPLYY